ncbi:MAG: hemerythrin domain-containing protein [Clostridium sp.]
MKRYVMTPALRTGNEMIDTEHQRIFDEINVLQEACQEGRARTHLREMAEFLSDYVAVHFSDEENLQIESQYPDYNNHKKFHEWYKNELKKSLNSVRTESNMFLILREIERVTEILLKHIETEDTRLAKWVRESEAKKTNMQAERTISQNIRFVSAFQPVSGKKEIDLHALADLSGLQKHQELFAEATGMACAVTDLSGRYLIRGSGSSVFLNRYSQGRQEELVAFTEPLIIDGYQAGSIIGGIVKDERNGGSQITPSSVLAAGKLFAETVNYWFNTQMADQKDCSGRSSFQKEAGQIQEAIRQIKSRAKGLEQTATMEKMLSLNAAIEAGRAGKAGVGFAVVAEEIGRMANESAAIYREIQDLVRQVEESMKRMEQESF